MLNHSTYPVFCSLLRYIMVYDLRSFFWHWVCDIFAEDQVRSIFTVWSEHMSVLNEWVFTIYSSHFSEDNRKVMDAPVILLGQIDQSGTKGRLAEYTKCSVPSSELGPLLTHLTQKRVSPLFGSKAGDTLAWLVRGLGDPISDEWTGTLNLYVYFNPSTGRLDNFWYLLDNPTQPLARGREERGRTRGARMSFCWWGIRWSWAFKRYEHKIINKQKKTKCNQ
jgi:hypothetical protein